MKTSLNGLNSLTKPSEGIRYVAYDDYDSSKKITHISQVKGTLTIGYGHTKGVFVGQTCSEKQAFDWLQVDIQDAENFVNKVVKVPLTQNMFDALTDFVFNAGSGNFSKSTLLKKVNASDYEGAAEQFMAWTQPNSPWHSGLLVRCTRRRQLFLTGLGVLPYFAPDGTRLNPQTSTGNSILKFIAAASILNSI